MKVVLIYPYFLEQRVHAEEIAAIPLGLYYIGAMLKAHHYDVEILNWHAMGDQMAIMREALVRIKPDIIGFSIVHANRWGAIDLAGLAKSLDPGVITVFGGIGATFLWKHLLTHFKQIDYIVLGEGEINFLGLVRSIESGSGRQAICKIPGLALRDNGKPIQTSTSVPIEDLDSLPSPARYFDFQHLSLTRGCPGRCTFCGSPRFWGRRVRSHTTDYFVGQLEMLAARGTNFFFISDDTFTLKPELVIDICQKIIMRGLQISWQAISKVNAITSEMLFWMRKAGCIQISFGIESGDSNIRRCLRKDINPDQIERAFLLCAHHGILARAYFIYGSPGESDETINATLDLIRRIKPLGAIFYLMDIFPGTALYEDYLRRTGANDDIWLERIEDILYFESDPQMNKDTVLAWGKKLRQTYHQWLPQFALDLNLPSHISLQTEQADYLSRLGLTFSHGDYSQLSSPEQSKKVAVALFERALAICPDHRAYWGLALCCQDRRDWPKAAAVLDQGLGHFPESRQLRICRGIICFHQKQFKQALTHLLPFKADQQTWAYLALCYQALGEPSRAAKFSNRLR
jgi:anaerobic magnesium-protoporphyrin IX monomethyl ester cyclase